MYSNTIFSEFQVLRGGSEVVVNTNAAVFYASQVLLVLGAVTMISLVVILCPALPQCNAGSKVVACPFGLFLAVGNDKSFEYAAQKMGISVVGESGIVTPLSPRGCSAAGKGGVLSSICYRSLPLFRSYLACR